VQYGRQNKGRQWEGYKESYGRYGQLQTEQNKYRMQNNEHTEYQRQRIEENKRNLIRKDKTYQEKSGQWDQNQSHGKDWKGQGIKTNEQQEKNKEEENYKQFTFEQFMRSYKEQEQLPRKYIEETENGRNEKKD